MPGWAVLVGINTYNDDLTSSLQCCVRDAIALYAFVTHPSYTNLAPQHVHLVLDGLEVELRAAALSVADSLRKYGLELRKDFGDEIVRKRNTAWPENITACFAHARAAA